jgi:5-methyltetrahydrofolate--homocysteine methyltransferase
LSIGLNCSLGADGIVSHVEELARYAGCAISVHPNAGLPNEIGEYDDTPENMARILSRLARRAQEPDAVAAGAAATGDAFTGAGVNIVGGCCGTTPEHIKAIAQALRGIPPRKVPQRRQATRLAGLEPCEIDADSLFFNVGERTNVAGSRKFARLIREGKYPKRWRWPGSRLKPVPRP